MTAGRMPVRTEARSKVTSNPPRDIHGERHDPRVQEQLGRRWPNRFLQQVVSSDNHTALLESCSIPAVETTLWWVSVATRPGGRVSRFPSRLECPWTNPGSSRI